MSAKAYYNGGEPMIKYFLILLLCFAGCSYAKTSTSASKSGPIVEKSEGVTTSGTTYKTKDEGVFVRICSLFGMSANEAAVNRKGIELNAKKGIISAGAGDYGFLERAYIGIRNILFWLVGGIALAFGLSFVPGPVGTVAGSIFSMLPVLGGLFQKVKKENVTKSIVNSVQAAKGVLLPDDRQAFNDVLEMNQNADIKKVVKNIK